jgi:hypothetical protein
MHLSLFSLDGLGETLDLGISVWMMMTLGALVPPGGIVLEQLLVEAVEGVAA